VVTGISPISSRKIVPPSASSNRPRRAAIAPVKAPFSWPKISLLVAEDLRFEQGFRKRRHVHGDEGLVTPWRERVDSPGYELFARPGLARNENRGLHRRDLHHAFQGLPDRVGLPDDARDPLKAFALDHLLPHRRHVGG
jgi:hypothetical protein